MQIKKIIVKELDVKRYKALVGQSRNPDVSFFSKELAWYSNEDESIIGVLLLDITDNDYSVVILGRDEVGCFRAFDVTASISTKEAAKTWLEGTIKWHSSKELKIFPQGDTSTRVDLFTPIVKPEKQHLFFTRLIRDSAFSSARDIISEMMLHFVDVDGNFVEQFQSTGFDARLWELYLNAYFVEESLFLKREYSAPDFLIQKYEKVVAVEAVIVGRKNDNPVRYFREYSGPQTPEEILKENENSMPIKFGSPLFSKLQKKYWELDHVRGNPLIFAIADFHDDHSMLWSSTALTDYLYGFKYDFYYDENNQLIITPLKIKTHKIGKKKIPSGYFFQPDSENVSAILFSSSGTISKFNRMGKQAGFGDPKVYMFRVGSCYDHNPNASVPRIFKYKVDENCQETWSEGLSMFHNPNALCPVPEELFPSIAHHHFQDYQIASRLPEFYPYSSVTYLGK